MRVERIEVGIFGPGRVRQTGTHPMGWQEFSFIHSFIYLFSYLLIETTNDCVTKMKVTFGFFVTQNTAIHLAATNGHAAVVAYLLSVKEQDILMNGNNQNILDIAVTLERTNVAMEIAKSTRRVFMRLSLPFFRNFLAQS